MDFLSYFRKLYPVKAPTLPTKGFGLIEKIPEQTDFVLGSANQALKIILSPERDFSLYLPVTEPQSKTFDTYSCVTFSALNNIEIIHKKQFGVEKNFSDRYISSLSDTVPGVGNGFKKVADTIRKNGLVSEEEYPFGGDDGYEYVQKPAQSIVDKGKLWLMSFEIQYEWVDFGGCDPNKLYDALQFGPLQVSADANALRTKERSTAVNHAVTIYKSNYKRSFSIFDHYDAFTYDVPWNFYFGSAMQYSLLKKKFLPLVMVYGSPEIFAIIGNTACHITDEASWHYGEQIGAWDKGIQVITQSSFNQSYTKGESITFKQ